MGHQAEIRRIINTTASSKTKAPARTRAAPNAIFQSADLPLAHVNTTDAAKPNAQAPTTSRRATSISLPNSYVMSFIKKHALAMIFAAGLGQAVALSQSPLPPTESSLSRNPALVRDWANRLQANDPKVRATAEAALVQGARRSLPLLRRFLDPGHEDLHVVTFEIIQRIGPPAIPLLVDLLRHE